MPPLARVPLAAATTQGKWWVDVDTSSTATPSWVGVHGISDVSPGFDPNLEDDSDLDSAGWASSTKTGEAWTLELTLIRKVTAASATTYDPGQEWLRTHGPGKKGTDNRVHIRWYEMEGPRTESYEGYAAVSWSPEGGKVTDLSTVSVTLTGQGRLLTPTHPNPAS